MTQYRKGEHFLDVELSHLAEYSAQLHDLMVRSPNEYIPVVSCHPQGWKKKGGTVESKTWKEAGGQPWVTTGAILMKISGEFTLKALSSHRSHV